MATQGRRPFRAREHPNIEIRRNRASIRALVPPDRLAKFDADFPHSTLPPLPQKRGPREDHEDLERHVLNAVGEYLSAHPQVLLAVRQNSGSMPYDRNGRAVPVWFYKLLRSPDDVTITDYWGFLRDGRPYAIEAKRPSWKWAGSEREIKQRAFIQMIEAIGGVGGFVRGLDEARVLIP